MSWREVLGVADPATPPSHAHNPHNPHKAASSGHCADIADSAQRDPELLQALATACGDLPIAPVEVRDALSPEDLEDWHRDDIQPEILAAFARSLVQRRAMAQGKVPADYKERATCKRCGPIWLWFSGEVVGCPWCWNRTAGRPIPRPRSVRCGDCAHFERIDHPHLGHCRKGQPEAIAGLWDSDSRYCERYLPQPATPPSDKPNAHGAETRR